VALGLRLLQSEIFLDAVHKPGAKLFLFTVHRENRHLAAESDNDMAAVACLERASLLLQPAL
jgi:hypothetical protein